MDKHFFVKSIPKSPPPFCPIWSIHIDQKLFTLQSDETSNGQFVKIMEKWKTSSQSICISWKALTWLSSSFHTLHCEPYNYKFFKKFLDNGAILWLEILHNKNGYYVEFTLLYHMRRMTKLFISSKANKQGCFSFYSLLSDYMISTFPPLIKVHTYKVVTQSNLNKSPKNEVFKPIPNIFDQSSLPPRTLIGNQRLWYNDNNPKTHGR